MERFGKRTLLRLIVTFFGAGLISQRGPGTVGSFAAGITAAILMLLTCSGVVFAILAACLFVIGCVTSHAYIITYKFDTNRDPGYIVIDEASAVFLLASVANFHDEQACFATFAWLLFLFVLFDATKPTPIRQIEEYLKRRDTTAAAGIMIDDTLAAIYATAAYFLGRMVFC